MFTRHKVIMKQQLRG